LAENIAQIDEMKSLLNNKDNDVIGLKDERRVLSDKIALYEIYIEKKEI